MVDSIPYAPKCLINAILSPIKKGDGIVFTKFHASSATPAFLAYDRLAILDREGPDKAYPLRAPPASGACVSDFYCHTRHAGHFCTYRRGKGWKHHPQAAAGTAIAHGQKLFTGAYLQPRGIELISSYKMNKPGFPAFSDMCKGLLPGGTFSEGGIYFSACLSDEKASKIMGIILAIHRFPADAEIHDPEVSSFAYQLFYRN